MTKGFNIEYPLLPRLEGEEMPSGRCPHCKRHTIFSVVNSPATPIPEGAPRPEHYRHGLQYGVLALVQCGHPNCRSVVYREYHAGNDALEFDLHPPVELTVDSELESYTDLKRSFGEALTTYADGTWNSSAQALRRALQDAMKLKKPEGTTAENWADKQLKKQIEILVQQRVLTLELGAWAQEGRIVGVIAAHGEPGFKDWADEQDAKEALEFTKWVLRYLFVLPEQLKNRKARLAQEASKTKKPSASQ